MGSAYVTGSGYNLFTMCSIYNWTHLYTTIYVNNRPGEMCVGEVLIESQATWVHKFKCGYVRPPEAGVHRPSKQDSRVHKPRNGQAWPLVNMQVVHPKFPGSRIYQFGTIRESVLKQSSHEWDCLCCHLSSSQVGLNKGIGLFDR